MNRISVNGSSKYDVIVLPGLLSKLGLILNDELQAERALVVTDSNVAELYIDEVLGSLRDAEFEYDRIILPAGEESKSLSNYERLLSCLAENGYDRSDAVIALGGGMIGDIAGFAAATFKRGMQLIEVPTSLLACVDSSVGGKTAVNLPLAKNQIGSFYNPTLVVCDPSALRTLPPDKLLEAYAEIIKYGILSGYEIIEALREALSGESDFPDYSSVILSALSIKRDIIEMDEKDESFRQYLNLGHLVGHAIEAHSHYSISHGQAVAEGLAIEAKACALYGLCPMSTYIEITDILEEFGFNLSASYSVEDLIPYILKDKRLRSGRINIIVPNRIGECTMKSLPVQDLARFIRLGL